MRTNSTFEVPGIANRLIGNYRHISTENIRCKEERDRRPDHGLEPAVWQKFTSKNHKSEMGSPQESQILVFAKAIASHMGNQKPHVISVRKNSFLWFTVSK
jgi:hypothetical protein